MCTVNKTFIGFFVQFKAKKKIFFRIAPSNVIDVEKFVIKKSIINLLY